MRKNWRHNVAALEDKKQMEDQKELEEVEVVVKVVIQ
jgi:hypothetical protein